MVWSRAVPVVVTSYIVADWLLSSWSTNAACRPSGVIAMPRGDPAFQPYATVLAELGIPNLPFHTCRDVELDCVNAYEPPPMAMLFGSATAIPDCSVMTGPPPTEISYTPLLAASSHTRFLPSLAMLMTLLVVGGCASTNGRHEPLWHLPP